MGPFADTVFTILLGWVQNAAQGLWRIVTGAEAEAWFSLLMEHWLELVILLCVAGAAIDLIIYLIRWQPYRVWRSFLQRRKKAEQENPAAGNYRQWLYADGSTRMEEIPSDAMNACADDPEHLNAPIRPVRRVIPANAAKAYNKPYYPPQWGQPDESSGGNA